METEQAVIGCDLPAPLDLAAIEVRNHERREMKAKATAGPWFVKTNIHKGAGAKYEVKRTVPPKNGHSQPTEETVIPEGWQKDDRAFIAFARNDAPEKDIEALIARIRQLATYEDTIQAMANRIRTLEEQNRQLQTQVRFQSQEIEGQEARIRELSAHEGTIRTMANRIANLEDNNTQQFNRIKGLEKVKQECLTEFDQYKHDTETLHIKALKLRRALEFYADANNWEWRLVRHPMLTDNGDTAREALASTDFGVELLESVKKLEAVAEAASHVLQETSHGAPSNQNWNALMVAYTQLVEDFQPQEAAQPEMLGEVIDLTRHASQPKYAFPKKDLGFGTKSS
jgi:hypothetical protein